MQQSPLCYHPLSSPTANSGGLQPFMVRVPPAASRLARGGKGGRSGSRGGSQAAVWCTGRESPTCSSSKARIAARKAGSATYPLGPSKVAPGVCVPSVENPWANCQEWESQVSIQGIRMLFIRSNQIKSKNILFPYQPLQTENDRWWLSNHSYILEIRSNYWK